MNEDKVVRVGLLGCGVVGGATARILIEESDEIARQAGVRVELARVAVRNPNLARAVELPPEIVTTDAEDIVRDPSIDLIVETIGGVEPAKSLIGAALDNNKHVVTANKELLAQAAPEVMAAAQKSGTQVLFEASVAGGIPIIRPIRESLAGDTVHRIMGIVNGTTNFILTRMSDTGETFEDALAEADRLGYTEADPSADIDGHDAASKLAILASLAFNAQVVADDVTPRGDQGRNSRRHRRGPRSRLRGEVARGCRRHGRPDRRSRPPCDASAHPSACGGTRRVQRRLPGSHGGRGVDVLR